MSNSISNSLIGAKPSKPQYYNGITIMKAIATLFITWFHFKWFVPQQLAPLFIGGAIGNSLFFFCSGYLLSFKEERYVGQWLLKKYLRVMPAAWVTMGIIIFFDLIRTGVLHGFSLIEWFYPKQFWFVRAILAYFLVTYLAYFLYSYFHNRYSKVISKNWLVALMIITLVVHVVYYFCFVDKSKVVMDAGGFFCWFYWYSFFLLGYYVKNYREEVKSHWFSLVECVFSIGLFFIYKRLAPHQNVLIYLQFIFIPALLLYIVYAFTRGGQFLSSVKVSEQAKKGIITLANMTLEVYLVQWYFINWIMPSTTFPLNLFFTLVIIFVVAYITHVISGKVGRIKSRV